MFTIDDLSSAALQDLVSSNNWQAQYRLITQWGKLIQPKPELRKPEYLVRGCEVSAWLAHAQADGVHCFAFDSDSRVINGLAVLLLLHVNHKSTAAIAGINLAQRLTELGLEKHLTPSRNNGLQALIDKIHALII